MKKKDFIFGIGIIVLGIIIDQVIKIIVRANMEVLDSITFIPHFINFTHVENTGAAWSFMSNNTILLIIISIIILGYFCYRYKDIDFKGNPIFSSSLVLVISGTIGNLIDRCFFQSVTDYIDVEIFSWTGFPIFNFADILLVVGFIVFIIWLVFFDIEDKEKHRPVLMDSEIENDNTTLEASNDTCEDVELVENGEEYEGTDRNS